MGIVRTIINTVRFGGGQYRCNVCNRRVAKFFPFSTSITEQAAQHGFPYSFREMETLNVDQCNCPFCLSSDRERLYLLYLSSYLQKNHDRYRVLDFAPSPHFSKRLKKTDSLQYTSADIDRTDVDIHVDICNMKELADRSFDIVICSHVLEHVASPAAALLEIRRVMTSDAIAIIMVPLFAGVAQTTEDLNTKDEAERWRRFGQGDHVRLYSRTDFLQQLSAVGFRVEQLAFKDFSANATRELAIAENSVLIVCRKGAVRDDSSINFFLSQGRSS